MQLHVDGRSTTKQFPWKPMNQSGGSVPLARVRTVAAEARGLSIIKIKVQCFVIILSFGIIDMLLSQASGWKINHPIDLILNFFPCSHLLMVCS